MKMRRAQCFSVFKTLLSDCGIRFQLGAFRQHIRFQEAPQRNQKFACQSDDPDLSHPLASMTEALLLPKAEIALGLEPKPPPRNLDRHPSDMAIARMADPLLLMLIPALKGSRSQARQCPNLFRIPKLPPAKELHHVQPRAIDPDSPQRVQLKHVVDHRDRVELGESRDVLPRAFGSSRYTTPRVSIPYGVE